MSEQTTMLLDKLRVAQELLDAAGRWHDDGAGHDWLDTVQALRMLAQTAESAQRQAVALAREQGASWEQVGRWLGTSRQAAHERFAGVGGGGAS